MTTSHVLNLQQSSAHGRVAAQDICMLEAGAASSLRPRVPMALRVMHGSAWVTLDDGPNGAQDRTAGDVFLHAGQTLWVAGGQHAVVEAVGGGALQFRWRTSSAVKQELESAAGIPWWRQAALNAEPCYA